MNRVRLLWVLSIVTILAMVLVSCKPAPTEAPVVEEPAAEEPAEEPAEEEPAAPAEKTKVTLWTDPPGGGEAATCFSQTVVDPFNEQSDTVLVEVVYQPEAWDAIRTALAGGAGPDIVDTPGPSFVYELVQAGQLLGLDEFADEFGWGELFVPWALSLGEVDGELYSIADELETLVLYYNTAVFEEHGWEPPTTWVELNALCEKMEDAGVIPFSHGNADWRPANEWFVGEYLNHVAGPDKVYQALTGKIPWTDSDFVRSIELLNEHQQNGWFMGGLEFYYTTGWDDYIIALATGEAAMKIEGTWVAGALNEQIASGEYGDNDWDWVPVPSTSGKAIFDLGMGHTWSVNKKAENPRAAAEFLTYFFSPQVQARRFRDCDLVPGPVRLEADALEGIDSRIAGMIVALSEASDAGDYGYTTWTFWPPKSDVYIYEEIERVWAGEITSKEYLEGLREIFDQEFAAGEMPPIPTR
jgi:raffinose/stachyose/melibiose transport system substrate-binding protein